MGCGLFFFVHPFLASVALKLDGPPRQTFSARGRNSGSRAHRSLSLRFDDYLRPAQVEMALSRAVQRNPTGDEIDRGIKLIEKLQLTNKVDAQRALEYFCLVVLNLNEFMYLD